MLSLLAPVSLGTTRPPVILNASSKEYCEDRAAGPGPWPPDITIERSINTATVKSI